eukprot:CAMPEP_0172697716 /NCGR_PEP_ID=MMETSP1074-20121228/28954_1 /TAXON_ID=2916 /ORGANISM="Ceratium fusus, Strain PA161109" /LENGTH=178 /DNA_ID=CAMNT_0013518653 /DNA_START=1209 /DNA_END=1741 /DNA_ORIENTATION=+
MLRLRYRLLQSLVAGCLPQSWVQVNPAAVAVEVVVAVALAAAAAAADAAAALLLLTQLATLLVAVLLRLLSSLIAKRYGAVVSETFVSKVPRNLLGAPFLTGIAHPHPPACLTPRQCGALASKNSFSTAAQSQLGALLLSRLHRAALHVADRPELRYQCTPVETTGHGRIILGIGKPT